MKSALCSTAGVLPMFRLAWVLCAASTFGAEVQAPPFLLPGQVDAVVLLPGPPPAESPEQAADLFETAAVHAQCSASDAAAGNAEKKVTVFRFAPVIGTYFNSTNLPTTAAFFEQVQREADAVTDAGKNFWKRPRPYVVDPDLARTVGEMEKSFSYPSGHATRGMVFALVLAEIYPDKRDDLIALGRTIGWHRVQLARHYPTDIYAGRTLAQALVRQMKASPEFQRRLAEVRGELAAAPAAAAVTVQ
ncbi:MAG: phosphatase PAP2 family protein [Verrucomicrobiota bacterium]